MGNNSTIVCAFCKSVCYSVYRMKTYDVYQCGSCGTGRVWPMPDMTSLEDFYKGFLFSADIKNLNQVFKSSRLLYPLIGLETKRNLKMLDVGGGGGFYSKTFEELGYGCSTYMDLDSDACRFAEQLGLENIINGDASQADYGGEKFDFIMCRHLVEHLIDPVSFINSMLELLSSGGIFLLICPNGNSLEYIAYPYLNLKKRVRTICRSNNLSKIAVWYKMVSGQMLHGIDPPRHLWAITPLAFENILDKNKYSVTIKTYPLSSVAFSPYYSPSSLFKKICTFLGNTITSKVQGGTHLVAVIRQK